MADFSKEGTSRRNRAQPSVASVYSKRVLFARSLLRSRRSYLLRHSFLEMTLRREALRCRARLNLLAPPGLYSAH